MIDCESQVRFRVGDEVAIDSLGGQRAAIEAIRIISNAKLVEEYQGLPTDVVLTLQIGDATVNKRAREITLPSAT